jgi:hypothetical protein
MLEVCAFQLTTVRPALGGRRDLVVGNALLRHQLAVRTRPTRKRPGIRARGKLLRVLARRLCPDWRRHLLLVRPETVVGWHRRGWCLFRRGRSRSPLGRPRLLVRRAGADGAATPSQAIEALGALAEMGFTHAACTVADAHEDGAFDLIGAEVAPAVAAL